MRVNLLVALILVVSAGGAGAIVDGIRSDGRGGILVSDFNGRLLRVAPGGAVVEILDTTASGAYCADFEYVPETGLLDPLQVCQRVEQAWRDGQCELAAAEGALLSDSPVASEGPAWGAEPQPASASAASRANRHDFGYVCMTVLLKVGPPARPPLTNPKTAW